MSTCVPDFKTRYHWLYVHPRLFENSLSSDSRQEKKILVISKHFLLFPRDEGSSTPGSHWGFSAGIADAHWEGAATLKLTLFFLEIHNCSYLTPPPHTQYSSTPSRFQEATFWMAASRTLMAIGYMNRSMDIHIDRQMSRIYLVHSNFIYLYKTCNSYGLKLLSLRPEISFSGTSACPASVRS